MDQSIFIHNLLEYRKNKTLTFFFWIGKETKEKGCEMVDDAG